MIDIIDTDKGFDALAPEWRSLEANPRMRIFQTFLWNREGWREACTEHPENNLWILRWHQNGNDDVVIFPFFIDGKGTLRFIYDTHCDLLDTVYKNGGNRHICYREAVGAILSNPHIRSICLHKMYGESEALQYLGVLLKGSIVARDNAFSWLDIQKSPDFIKSLTFMPSKDRADLKGILRKAEGKVLKVFSVTSGDQFPEALIESLAVSMRTTRLRGSSFFPQPLMQFARCIYEKNKMDIATLFEGDKCVAANFLLKKDDRVVSWIFLYTDNRASTELYVKYLSQECIRRSLVFDFGVGVYSYKIGTFRPQTGVTFAIRYGKTHLLQAKAFIDANIRLAKDYIKASRSKSKCM